MFGLFGIASIISTCIQGIKEACTPSIPAENWANKELYYEDMMKGISTKERMKNVQNGKYKLTEKYPEPHRDPKTGKIIIENYELYKKDVMDYGAPQAYKWLHQGKYNLMPEELEKQREEFRKKMNYLYSLASDDNKKEERLEEQRKEETERLERQQSEQDMLAKQQHLIIECTEILQKVNYTDVDLKFNRPLFVGKQYAYSYWRGCIKARKNNEDYYVSFCLSDSASLPYAEGHSLIKKLANVIAAVDISYFENRDIALKEAFISEGLLSHDSNEQFKFELGSLTININYYDQQVTLIFHTSNWNLTSKNVVPTNIAQKNFDIMAGHEFEYFCAELLMKNGYERINVTQGSGDQGIDIVAIRDGIKYGIQCKCYSSDIGNKAVQEVFAGKAFYECHIGVVLTNQFFTKSAVELAKKNGIILWDRNKLLELIKNSTDNN